jgi:hypothetical protein
MDSMCKHFARRGFIAMNIEYRRGRVLDTVDTKFTTIQHEISVYKGGQDMRGACRSAIKLQRFHTALNLPFQIDTTKIFLGGNSAGALMSMLTAYYRDQAMIDTAFPVAPGSPKFKDVLGPINADFYYGDTTIEYRSKIKGVFAMWGGMPIPVSFENNKAAFFGNGASSTDNAPMIGFHGALDPIFPIQARNNRFIFHRRLKYTNQTIIPKVFAYQILLF